MLIIDALIAAVLLVLDQFTKHLAVVLTRYVTGSAAAMGRRNHISIDNKYIVLDTSGMPDDLILPGICYHWNTNFGSLLA